MAAAAAKNGRPEPLAGHPKYEKASPLFVPCHEADMKRMSWCECQHHPTTLTCHLPALHSQIRDLNSGTFGFVQLCKDRTTGELVAIKFIERGDKVGPVPRIAR
jgi:hypothetical protein